MRQPYTDERAEFPGEGRTSNDSEPLDADRGARDFRELLASLCDSACVVERLGLVTRFARFAARSDIADAVRGQALRVVQDLARRKQEEAACTRGLETMKVRVQARAKR